MNWTNGKTERMDRRTDGQGTNGMDEQTTRKTDWMDRRRELTDG